MIENKDIDKADDKANAVNDGTNKYLKTMRQGAMVDNVPLIFWAYDDQRPEDWGAVARDLCTVIHIDAKSDEKLAMPFFLFGEWLYEWMTRHFEKHYEDYRFRHGDNTLFMYIYKGLYSLISHHRERIVNTFGYRKLDLSTESGRLDGKLDKHYYYLCNKKIYSDRFATDALGGFFAKKAERSKVGLVDQKSYRGKRSNFDEMGAQNSYSVKAMSEVFDSVVSNGRKEKVKVKVNITPSFVRKEKRSIEKRKEIDVKKWQNHLRK